MATTAGPRPGAAFDGTTGRGDHRGRRTHVIQLLRDSRGPVTVRDVAEQVGVPASTARFHLEALVDAGLAERTQEPRTTPGRPRVVYRGTLPNQTHERAQAYRLLAESLTVAVAETVPGAQALTYTVGRSWGRSLCPGDDAAPLSEDEVTERLVATMDALWFAPATDEPAAESGGGASADLLRLHHCPFVASSRCVPQVVCALHAGFINGTLAELGSVRRLVDLSPQAGPHHCVARLERVDPRSHDDSAPVPIHAPDA